MPIGSTFFNSEGDMRHSLLMSFLRTFFNRLSKIITWRGEIKADKPISFYQ
jgi:hypothetical protein